MSELVFDRLEVCKKLYIANAQQNDYSFVIAIENNVIVECDEYYFKQTLDNLITNAFTYCKKGEIKLELTKNGNQVNFRIIDEGIGIPQEELYDIFGEFIVSSKTRTPAGGRGVGLALCKKVLAMHKGDIRADSLDNKTVFTFTLPIKFDDEAKPISEEIRHVAKNLLKDGINIKSIAKATGMKESQIRAIKVSA